MTITETKTTFQQLEKAIDQYIQLWTKENNIPFKNYYHFELDAFRPSEEHNKTYYTFSNREIIQTYKHIDRNGSLPDMQTSDNVINWIKENITKHYMQWLKDNASSFDNNYVCYCSAFTLYQHAEYISYLTFSFKIPEKK